MKYSDIKIYKCPECRGDLEFTGNEEKSVSDIDQASIRCIGCNRLYQVIGSIPRFVKQDNYAYSFSYQWGKFKKTQINESQNQISSERFYLTTKWPKDLKGQLILEAGCGVGRFTEIALHTGATVFSFDLSSAVEVAYENIKNNVLKHNHHLSQADIYKIPFPEASFDKIFCLGVLQHCPNVKKAYLSLVSFLKPGGELVVDCYLRQPLRDAFNLKYILRPFCKYFKASFLFSFCSKTVSLTYDIKSFFAKIPLIGPTLSKFFPIGALNYGPKYEFSVQQMKEIKTLSMFDMLSPRFDNPQKLSDFSSWIEEAGLDIIELTTGYNGINAHCVKRAGSSI